MVRGSQNQSEDPFGVYELLNKKKVVRNNVGESLASPTYPPGFTPNDVGVTNVDAPNVVVDEPRQNEDQEEGEVLGIQDQIRKDGASDAHESTCSGHFKKSKGPSTGGSILQCIDDVVHVGQTMGYDMTGCIKIWNKSSNHKE